MEVSIRSAAGTDAGALGALFAQLGYPGGTEGLEARLEALLSDERADVLVAVDANGQVVGALTLYLVPVAHEPGPWCRMTAVVVAETARSEGVGAALVGAAEAVAERAGCTRIEATSKLNRTRAHAFYERLGYAREAAHFVKRP